MAAVGVGVRRGTRRLTATSEIDRATPTRLTAPTLVVQGDRDEVTLAHSVEVVAALPDARLAVLPRTHGLPVELPDAVNRLIVSFLRAGAPQAAWDVSAEGE